MGSPNAGAKVTIKPGDPPLQAEGSVVDHLYVIVSGRAHVFMQDRVNPDNAPIKCDEVRTGSLVGEELLLSPHGVKPIARYTVRVPKEESLCIAWKFTLEEFQSRLRPDPDFASLLLVHALEYRHWSWAGKRDMLGSTRASGTRRIDKANDPHIQRLEQELANAEAIGKFAQSANAVSIDFALRWVLQGIQIDPDDPLSSAIGKIRMLGAERAWAGQQMQRILDRLRRYMRTDPVVKDAAHALLQLFGVSGSSPAMPAVRRESPIPREDPSEPAGLDYEDLKDTKREEVG